MSLWDRLFRAPTIVAGEPDPALGKLLLMLHNQERPAHPLLLNTELMTAANYYAHVMAHYRRVAHEGLVRQTWDQRIRAAGYRGPMIAENLAQNQGNTASLMMLWMKSPGHRANILDTRLKFAGFGRAYDGADVYWCACFGG